MSITKDQLIQFIEKPWLLKEQTLVDLKEIIVEFPYFQSAQLLFTYNLYTRDNFRYEAYLKTCSIYANDRAVLYRLLQPKSTQNPTTPVKEKVEFIEKDSSALLDFSEEGQITDLVSDPNPPIVLDDDQTVDFDMLSFEQPDNLFQLDESATIIEIPANPQPNIPVTDDKVDLIAQFIKVNPSIPPRIETRTPQIEHFELLNEEDHDSDEFITETLARIYLKQGHYQKAIDAFNRLSLKFPEKSVYFAEQIEEIKKLLN